MCPQSLKQEVKDDLEETFMKLSKQKMKYAFKRAGQPWAGLIWCEGPSEMRVATTPSLPTRAQSNKTGGQPGKMNTPQMQVPRHVPASNCAAYFLWQENLFIWGK